MKYIMLFIPAIAWGLMPLVVSSVKKSNVYNQISGTVIGAFIVAVIAWLVTRSEINMNIFIWAAVAGIAWVIGQVGQYISYSRIGVSETMPISTGLQLIGVPLVGVLMFGEWSSPQAKLYGFIGIVVLIIGVGLTSVTDKGTAEGKESNQVSTIILLVLTTLGYITSSSIPKVVKGSSTSIFIAQTVGMLVAVAIYTLVTKHGHVWVEKTSMECIPAGIIFGIGTLTYTTSVKMNGVNLAFVISQLCVVISTLGGLVFLHEQKTKRGLIFTIVGLILIIAGAILTTLF